jgi:hypothetical protein
MRRGKRAAEFAVTGWEIIDMVSGIGGIFITNILVFLWYPFGVADWWARLLYGMGLPILPFCVFALLSRIVREVLKNHSSRLKDLILKAVVAVKTSIGTINNGATDIAGRVTIDPSLTIPRNNAIIPRIECEIRGNRVLLVVHNDDEGEAHNFAVRLLGITTASRCLQNQLPVSLGWDGLNEEYHPIGPRQSADLGVLDTGDSQPKDGSNVRHLLVNKSGISVRERGELYSPIPLVGELRFRVELLANAPIIANRISEWILTLDENGELRTIRQTIPITPLLGNSE